MRHPTIRGALRLPMPPTKPRARPRSWPLAPPPGATAALDIVLVGGAVTVGTCANGKATCARALSSAEYACSSQAYTAMDSVGSNHAARISVDHIMPLP